MVKREDPTVPLADLVRRRSERGALVRVRCGSDGLAAGPRLVAPGRTADTLTIR